MESRGSFTWPTSIESVDHENVAGGVPENVLVHASLYETLEETLPACSDDDEVSVSPAGELHDRLGRRPDGRNELRGQTALLEVARRLDESLLRHTRRLLGLFRVDGRRDIRDDERRPQRLGEIDGAAEGLARRIVVGDQNCLHY